MQINAAMDACEADCAALREFYSGYSYLWTVDLDTAFEEFKVSFVFFFPSSFRRSKPHPNRSRSPPPPPLNNEFPP